MSQEPSFEARCIALRYADAHDHMVELAQEIDAFVAAERAQLDVLVNEKMEALAKPIWLKEKPSSEAQSIRLALCFELSPDEEVHDYVVSLLDIAAQRGINLTAERAKPDATDHERDDPLHLKPCPCCGDRAVFGRINDRDAEGFGGEFITCKGCVLTTDLRFSEKEDARPLLAEAWNRRAAIAEARRAGETAGIEAMRELAGFIAINGCLVPPDGGEPTEDERELCASIARQIYAAQPALPLTTEPEGKDGD